MDRWKTEMQAAKTFEDRLAIGKRIMSEYVAGERNQDPEGSHGEQDDLLLAIIGDPQLEADFNATDKWYA